ncbi:High-affnity carbon uptake protein Hat/HatR [Minicystis rosea]|nr:High-affnity carbon uptake protein Hat/HatR [Minicystis rosea]
MGDANPYVGARPFTAGERLFGRDLALRDLVALVIAERIVVLHSPSGAGKTSLLQGRGGVIDKLREEGFTVLPIARVGLPAGATPPRNRYVESLLDALDHDASATDTLGSVLGSVTTKDTEAIGTVLIIDQFEEILTVDPTAEAERLAFFQALGQALQNRRLWAILSLRDEYVGALVPYRLLIPTHLRSTYRLDFLGPDEAREAIIHPASDAGVPFTDAAAEKLVQELRTVTVPRVGGVAERKLGPTVEPVALQVVCHRLWLRRGPDMKEITENDIDAVESVDVALADYYATAVEGAASRPGANERRIRAWIEQALITKAGVRSQVMRYGERDPGVPDASVDALIAAYILRQDMRRGVDWIELAHDRLVKPIQRNNAAWRREHLNLAEAQAALWEERGRDEALCLRGPALTEAERWAKDHKGELTPIEEQFLTASRKLRRSERENVRRRWWIIGALFAIAIAGVTGTLGLLAWRNGKAATRAQKALLDMSMLANARELLAHNQPAWAMKMLLKVTSPRERPGWIDLANEALQKNHLRATLRGHTGDVVTAEFSRDGQRVVTSSVDGTARVWNSDDGGAPLILRGHTGELCSASFSPDGERIVTASYDGTARIWDARNGHELAVLKGHTSIVRSAQFSPDGTRIATASYDGTARVWNADGSGPSLELRGHTDKVRSARWSPDGAKIVTASLDDTARVWTADGSGKSVILHGHQKAVTAAEWSPDGRRIVTASRDHTARVWNADGSGSPLVLRGHDEVVSSARFDSKGKQVVTTSDDWTARVWNATDGTETSVLRGHQNTVESASFSPDSTRIVTASIDGTARVWRADDDGEPVILMGHEANVWSARFNSDGSRIVTASVDRTARVWSAVDIQQAMTRIHGPASTSSVFSPKLDRFLETHQNGHVRVWSITGRVLANRKIHDAPVLSARWSPNGRRIVTASEDGTARVLDASNLSELFTLRGHEGAVRSAAFSPDGKRIVTGSVDTTARIWSAETGQTLLTLRGHDRSVWVAVWSDDGRRVATGSDDRTARVWDSTSGQSISTFRNHKSPVVSAAFSPDGQRVVTGSSDNTARIWNADGSGQSVDLIGHHATVWNVVFSPDGRQVATGSDDSTVRLWFGQRSSNAYVFRGHTNSILSVTFIPNQLQLMSISDENAVKTWTWSIPDLIHILQNANEDCLTPSLRVTYFGDDPAKARADYEACDRSHGRSPASSFIEHR